MRIGYNPGHHGAFFACVTLATSSAVGFAAQGTPPSPAATTLGTPAPARTSAWIAASPGDAMADVRVRLGDPLTRHPSGENVIARYAIHGMTASAEILEVAGRVATVEVWRGEVAAKRAVPVVDPYGVSIDSKDSDVIAKRGEPRSRETIRGRVVWVYDDDDRTGSLYEVTDGRVSMIAVAAKPSYIKTLSPAEVPYSPDGSSVDHAIIDAETTDTSAVDWEYLYLASNPCSGNARWKLRRQSLRYKGPRVYDTLDVVCPPTGETRTLYFDITAGFGRT